MFSGFGHANVSSPSKQHQLILVDSNVDDADNLAQSIADNGRAEILEAEQRPLLSILSELRENPGVTDLHLYSHAEAGHLSLGGQRLDMENLSPVQENTLRAIGDELGKQGGIYFYGCNLAAGHAGQDLVNKLADTTGVDVWASNDLTGSSALDGDWQLEVGSSGTTTNEIAFEGYQSVLNLIITPTMDPDTLRDTVMNPANTNVVITNVEVFGADGQTATFTNGLSVPGFISFEEGIILGSGEVVDIAGPNGADNTSSNMPAIPLADGDPQFDALTSAANGTFDATYITITFIPQQDSITGSFVFASDEYNEYAPPAGTSSANNSFYDVMAFFVNGVNYSVTAAGDNVSINTVNETLNAADYVTNDRTDGVPTPISIEPDGFTKRLVWTAPVNIGVPNTLKFGIADGGDATFDSWLLIDKYAFEVLTAPVDVDLAVSKTDNLTEVVTGDPIAYELTVTNTGSFATGREITLVDTLPTGVTVNGGLAEAVVEVGPNSAEWNCQSDAATPQVVTCKSIVPIQTNAGNNTSVVGFITDPISEAPGTTLVNSVVMSSDDNDLSNGNNTASDSSLVTASDTAAPVATLSGVPTLINNVDPFTVSVVFNEDVTGVDVSDLSVVGGVASNVVSIDGQNYTAVITPDGTSDVVVGVVAGAAQDAAGNSNTATATQTALLAINAVDLSLLNVPAQTSGSTPYTVTFEFSEDVIGFDASDIVVVNGVATNFVVIDANTYTADVLADGTGDVQIQVPDSAAQDIAGVDQSLAASGLTILNLSAPTVVVSGQPDSINTTASYTVAVEFSEDVTDFDSADLSVTNATILAVTAIDGNSYTVDVQPDGNGDISLSIPENSAIDIALNGNTSSNTVNTVYDAIAPQPVVTGLPVRTNTTGVLPITVTFNEPVTGFDLTDIQVTNGNVANLIAVDSQTFTADVTPDGNGDIGVSVPAAAAQDAAGNTSLIAVPVSTIYDDTAPTLTIAVVAGDNIINAAEDDADVTVSGSSAGLENGQTVSVAIDGTVYTTTANNDTWSIILPAAAAQLLDLTETITVDASDLAGNAAVTVTVDVTHDAIAPQVPVVGSLLTNNVSPVLMGTAALVAGDILQVTVEGVTYTAGAGAGELVVNGDGTWVLTIPATQILPEGVLDVTAVVTDTSGNTSSDQTTNEVVVDLSAPANPLVAPDLVSSSDSGSVDTDDVTLNASGEFTVPAGTLIVGDTVTLFADGVASGTTPVLADGSFLVNIATLTDADYAIQYSVTDAAGNESGLSPALDITVDTVIVVPTIDSPIASDNVVNAAEQNAVLVSGDAEADSVVVVTLSDGVNADVTVQVTTDATGNYTLLGSEANIQSLNEGNITIIATSTDLAGNVETSSPTDITLDTTAPAIPVVDTLISNSETPQLTGSATLTSGDVLTVSVNSVTYTNGDGNLQIDAGGVWTLDIPVGNELLEAQYEVVATVTDTSGNSSIDTDTSELTIDLTDPAVPTVTSSIQNTSTPVVGGTAVLEAGESLAIVLDGVTYVEGVDLVITGDAWTLTVPAGNPVTDGIYSVNATVTDAAGNSASDITASELLIDTVLPTIPSVIAQTTNNTQPVIMGTATVAAGETLSVVVNGITYNEGDVNLVLNPDDTWVLTIPADNAVLEGVYNVDVLVTDSAGNVAAEATVSELIVDTTAPITPSVAPNLQTAFDTGASDTDDVTLTTDNVFDVPAATATAGDVVVLYADGVEVATTTVAADGSFVANASTLTDGEYAITYTLTDEAGNVSADSPALDVTIDTVIVVPTIDAPVATDDIINSAEQIAVLISGTAEANSTVVVTFSDGVNADVTVQVTSDATGNYTLLGNEANIQSLDEGNITITATSTDLAGNVNTSVPVDVTLDATAPSIPVVDSLISNNATPQLTGSVSLAPSDLFEVVVNGITYINGSTDLQVDAGGVWTLDIPVGNELPEAQYEIVATVTDTAGNNVVDVSTVELTIDLTAPSAPVVISSIQGTNFPIIEGSAVIGAGEQLSILVNGVNYVEGSDLVITGDAWSLLIPATNPIVDGIYSVDATIVDAAGNSALDPTSSELTIDTSVPASPTVTAQITNNTQPVIMGTATVEPGETLTVVVNGITYTVGDGNLELAPGDTWVLSIPLVDAVVEGVYNVDVVVQDSAGNTSSETTAGELIVDTTSPVDPTLAPNLQTAFDTGASNTDDVTLTIDNVFDVPAATASAGDVVVLYADGVEIATTTVAADGSFVANASTLTDGEYAITYTLADEAGNVSAASPALDVTIDTVIVAPTIDAPVATDDIINSAEQNAVLISGTAEADSTVVVTLSDGVNADVSVQVLADAAGAYSLLGVEANIQSLDEGNIVITAVATDLAGNVQASLPTDVTLDTSAPAIPVVDTLISNLQTPVLTGSASLTAGDIFEVLVNGVTYTNGSAELQVNAAGVWTLNIPVGNELPEAQYDVVATVTDIAGNSVVDASTTELTIDLTAPAAPTVISSIQGTNFPVIEGLAVIESGDQLTVVVNGISYTEGADLVITGNMWSLLVPATNPVADGIYSVDARIIDAAGNSASDASSAELTIDTSSPVNPTVTAQTTNNTQPIIMGTATVEPGETLTVTVNGITYTAGDGNLELAPGDTWVLSIPVVNAVVEGVYNVDVLVEDSAGNTSSETTTGELIVDTTAPIAPGVAPNLQAAFDTGASDTDDITLTTDNIFDVPAATANAGNVVVLYADGLEIATTTVAVDGSFVANASTLADGDYAITYTLADGAGNVSVASPVLDVTIDTVIVVPTIDAPVSGDDIINSAEQGAVLVLGTAEANSTVVVTFSDGINADVTAQVTTDAAGDFTLLGNEANIQSLDEGNIVITATSTDLAGNVETSLPTNVTLDATAPSVPVVDALTTNNETPQLTGSLSLAPGDLFEVEVNGVTYSNAGTDLQVDAGGVWTLDIPVGNELPEAQYDIVATVTDTAGNSVVDTSTTELTIDLTAPAVPTVISSIQGTNFPIIEGSAVIEAGEQLTVVVNGVSYVEGADLVITGNMWNLLVPASNSVADGIYSVDATIDDAAGNSTSDTTSAELTIDTSLPANPTVTAQTTNNTQPVIMGTATVDAGETLTVVVNGITYTTGDGNLELTPGDTWVLTIPLVNAVTEGVYDVDVLVEDSAGNTSSEATAGELIVDTTSPADPTVAPNLQTAFDTGASDTDDVTLTIDNVFDVPATTASAGDTVVLYADGVEIATTTVAADGSFVANASTLTDGEYAITYTLADEAGNVSAVSPVLDVTIDTVIAVPTIDVPVATDNIINLAERNAVIVSGTAEANSSVIVTFSDGVNTDVAVQVTTDATGDYTLLGVEANIQSLDQGNIVITATSTDLAGNVESSLPIDVTLDSTAPTAPVIDTLITNNETPQLTGNVSLTPGDLFEVVVNGVTYTNAGADMQVNAAGVWTLTIPVGNELPEAQYDVLATVTDIAGNSVVDASTAELTIDITAPAVPTVVSSIQGTNFPVIEGSAVIETGDQLTVVVNGISYIEGFDLVITADTWSLSVPATNPVADGIYSVDATIVDAAGNIASDTTSSELTIDTSLPVNPTVTAQTTNSTQPILMGTATVEPGETLTVTVNSITYTAGDGNLELAPGDTWVLSIPVANAVVEGVYSVDVIVTDPAGNTASETTTSELVVDTTSPAQPAVAPNLQTAFDTGSSVIDNITFMVDNDFDVPADTATPGDIVVLYANGVEIGTTIVSANGSFVTNASTLADGDYAINYTLGDEAGNTSGLSPELDITVDTVMSVPTIDGPVSTDDVINAAEQFAVLVSGTAEENSAVVVSFSDGVNPDVNVAVTTDATGIYTLLGSEADVQSLDDGAITITATATDLAGNTEISLPTSLSIDTNAPSIPVVSPLVTNDESPQITGLVSLDPTDVFEVVVSNIPYSIGDGHLQVVDGFWTLDIPVENELPEAQYEVLATVTDVSGNSSDDVSASELTIDLSAPVVPTVVSSVQNTSTPIIQGTVTLGAGEILSVVVDGITYVQGPDLQVVDENWTVIVPAGSAINDGIYSVEAAVVDAAGNSSSDVTSAELTIDTALPATPAVIAQTTNNTQPVIMGTAIVEAGETLSVVVDGVTYINGDTHLVLNPDNTWELTIPAVNAIAEGVYNVDVIVTDIAGNASTEATAGELIVDTTSPTGPLIAPNLQAAFDTGVDDDDVTSTTDNVFDVPAGTVNPGSAIVLYADGIEIATATAEADGSFIANAGTLTQGSYAITYTEADEAGNVSPSSPALNIEIDTSTIIPVIAQAIESDDIVNVVEQTDVLITGTAEAYSEVLVTLTDAAAASVQQVVSTDGSGVWSLIGQELDISTLQDGLIEVSADASDIAGNTQSAVPVDITLDRIVPVITISPIATDDVINALEDDADVVISGAVSDVEDGNIVSFTLNGKSYSATVSAGVWSFILPALDAQGLAATNTLSADVSNTSGNAAVQATRVVSRDAIVPEITVSPIAVDNIINSVEDDSDIVISGTSIGLEDGQTVSISINGQNYNAIVAANTWTTTMLAADALALPVTAVLSADAQDVAGNAAAQQNANVIHDVVAPSVAIVNTIIANAANSNSYVVSGTCTAGDNDVVVQIAGATPASQSVLCNASGEWTATFDVSALADGSDVIVIDSTQSDIAGNSATAATVLQDKNVTIPSINIAVVAGDNYVNAIEDDSDVLIAGTVAAIEDGQIIEVNVNGVQYFATVVEGNWGVVAPASDVQAWSATESITADGGNIAGTAALTAALTVNHDTTAPITPAVIAQVTNNALPTIVGTATLAPGDVLTVTVGGQTYTSGDGFLDVSPDGTWELTVNEALAENTYDVTVTVTDVAGNSASETTLAELTIDTTSPATPLIAPDLIAASDSGSSDTDDITNIANAVFSVPAGTANAGESVELLADGQSIGSGVVAANGSFEVTTAILADALFDITYQLTDAAGNVSVDSPALAVTLDTQIVSPTLSTPVAIDNIIGTAEATSVAVDGTAESGSEVVVTFSDVADVSVDAIVTAALDGSWSTIVDLSGLENGPLTIVVESTDIAGNNAASADHEVDLDTVPSAIPTVDQLATNTGTPTLTGTALLAAGDTLSVELNSQVYNSAGAGALLANPDGSWVLTVPVADALLDGEYDVIATITDLAANTTSDVTAVELLVDTVVPTAPTVNTLITADSSPVLTGAMILLADETLELTLNSVTYTLVDVELTDNGDATWSLAVSNDNALADGVYEVVANVIDLAGNATFDNTINELIIDTTSPTVPTVISLTTNTATPVIMGTATVLAGETLVVSVNGIDYDLTDEALLLAPSGIWTLTIPEADAVADATYDVVASVVDAAGNTSIDTSTQELAVDTNLPVVPTVNALVANTGTPTLTGTATIGAGEILEVSVDGLTFSEGDGQLTVVESFWALEIPDTNALLQGNYDVAAVVTDSAGNASTDTTAGELTIDMGAPAVPVVVAQITNLATPVINGTANLSEGDILTVTVDGVAYTTANGLVLSSNDWSLQIPVDAPLAEATYSVDAVVTDLADNSSSDATTNELIVDLTAPTIALDVIAIDNIINALEDDTDIVISGSTVGVETGQNVSITLDGGITLLATVNVAGSWSTVLPASSAQALNESVTVVADVQDVAGNAAVSATQTLQHDINAPVVTIATSPIINSLNVDAFPLSGTCVAGEGNVQLSVSIGVPTNQSVSCSAEGDWQAVVNFSAVAEGVAVAQLVATQSDVSGNTSQPASASFDKDTQGPSIVISDNGSGGDNLYSTDEHANVSIGGTTSDVEDAQVVSISISDGTNTITDTAVVSASAWNVANVDLSALDDGSITITATVDDAIGNSAAPAISNAVLDTAAPTLTAENIGPTYLTSPALLGNTDLPDGAVVEIRNVDNIPFCEAIVSAGTWQCTPAFPLFDSINDLQAIAVDAAGNSVVTPFTVVIDTTIDTDGDGIADIIEGEIDTDLDGIVNRLDTDSDGDGIDDSIETAIDTDNDGIANYIDLDSDGDGLADADEGVLDLDNNGQPDYLDNNTVIDSDNDGISDAIEGTDDVDGDNIPNYLDTDSDDDGILDMLEGTDDVDGDSLPNYLDTDSDGDSIDDSTEAGNGSSPRDTDSDGVADFLDVDSDGDGIDDSVENNPASGENDIDEDTLPNYLDLDSDNDGILDALEGDVDTDGDLLPDYLDTDSDGDSLSDAEEALADPSAGSPEAGPLGTADVDGDGIPNHLDLDSDEDGLLDALETLADVDSDGLPNAIDVDSDGDGIADSLEAGEAPSGVPTDTDNDGTPDFLDIDSDDDGIDDQLEGVIDTDNDGVADFLDVDADGDGIADSSEGVIDTDGDGVSDYIDTDSDGDGIDDAVELGSDPNNPIDTDADGIPDYLDNDSTTGGTTDGTTGGNPTDGDDLDGDGVSDALDADIDGDGIPNTAEPQGDTDGDGVPDFRDTDSDNDGLTDAIEGAGDADGDSLPNFIDTDSDGDGIDDADEQINAPDADGIPNYLDTDSDNDGIPDSVEGNIDTDNDGIPDFIDFDSDDDGIIDIYEGSADSDSDGILDYVDTDSDDDGILDSAEGRDDTDNDGLANYLDIDSDGDGINDSIEGVVDTDNDGVPNYVDTDSDNDLTPDSAEGELDADGNGVPDYIEVNTTADTDGDGITDAVEGSSDSDGDGVADYLDPDSDGDGIPDELEGSIDSDADGIPDYLDSDSDADGVPDSDEGLADTDGDGIPNFLDRDSDSDGIPDLQEGGTDSDNDGVIDALDLDSDNDGVIDQLEAGKDSDNDGLDDAIDLDSDNDGLPDYIENRGIDANNDGQIDDFIDQNQNGLHDGFEDAGLSTLGLTPVDSDADQVPDYIDIDSDNDGLTDAIEADHDDANRDGRVDNFLDANGNGLDDSFDLSPVLLVDTDNDLIPDYRDVDSDQDGTPDLNEARGDNFRGNGVIEGFVDSNGDGLDDSLLLAPIQIEDTDQDGVFNHLELDSDNDGISDAAEVETPNQLGIVDELQDSDNDGIPDLIDIDQAGGNDADNDGIIDVADSDANPEAVDTDFDGIIDAYDADADGNGFSDQLGSNGLGAALPDIDADSIPDYLEAENEQPVRTGINGSGCSVGSASTDSGLLLLLLAAVIGIAIRRRRAIAIVLLAFAAANTQAQEVGRVPTKFDRGIYLAGGVGVSMLNPETEGTRWENDSSNSTGFQIALGYDFNKRITAELHFTQLGEATIKERANPAVTDTIEYQTMGASVLLYASSNDENLFNREGFLGYIRAGAGTLNNSYGEADVEQVNPSHFLVGIGFEYAMKNGLGVRGELISFDGDVQYGQLGLLYRFGHNSGNTRVVTKPAKKPTPKPAVKPKPVPKPAVTAAPKPKVIPKPAVKPKPAPVIKPKPAIVTKPKPVVPVAKDSDNDGVIDRLDRCANTGVGTPVDEQGCELFVGVVEGITFEVNSAQLTVEAYSVLNNVVAQLLKFPKINISIEAHTDNEGADNFNLSLSRKRAISVARYLVQKGVSQKRLKAKAFGESAPIADNATAAGRKTNRRVELRSFK